MTATEVKTDVSAQTNLPASYVVAKEPVAKMKRTLQGRVVSNKMQKTVTVLIERKVKHEMYGKYMSVSKKYHAHAEGSYNEGDLVEIQEGRPISKTKAWTVTKLLQAASV